MTLPHRPFDACVHCGLCLPACPTYGIAGSELDSPRGRIDLVRGLLDGTLADPGVASEHLDRCLGCRACETACPSGVRYGEVLEAGREALHASHPPRGVAAAALATFASPAATVWAMRGTAVARRLGLVAFARMLPGALGAAARVAPDPQWTPWSRTVPGSLGATRPNRPSRTRSPSRARTVRPPTTNVANPDSTARWRRCRCRTWRRDPGSMR